MSEIQLHESDIIGVMHVKSQKEPFYTISMKGQMRYESDGIKIRRDANLITFTDKKNLRELRHKITKELDDDSDLRDVIALFASRISDEDLEDINDDTVLELIFRDMKEYAEGDEHIIGIIHDERRARWEAEQERKDPLGYYGIPKPEL